MGKRRRRQPGIAEGMHGPKTESRIIEQLQSGPAEPPTEAILERERVAGAFEGKRRLVEDREQHDESEKNSERKRLFSEMQRGHDDGPSDNAGNLHGVIGSREHRADYKERGPDGLPVTRRP
jgi:hypothetical protein